MTAEQVNSIARCCRELGEDNANLRREVASLRAAREAQDQALASALRQIHELREGRDAQGT